MTDEKIDEEVAFLRSNLRAPKAADMLLALKARVEAAENNIEQQVVDAIKNRVALLEMQRDEALSRVGAAEYEAKRYCQDVAKWHKRAKIMEKALTKIASCKKHVDGDVVDIARKALEAKS